MYPWDRGFLFAQNEDNTILFSTTRTQDREKMFKSVGPIFTNAMCLIVRKDSNIKIDIKAEGKLMKIYQSYNLLYVE